MTTPANPYLDEFEAVRRRPRPAVPDLGLLMARHRLVVEFAWAVPNEAALAALVALSPIVEIGAGSGYWAAMLRARGATVHAYDVTVGAANNWGHTKTWTRVEEGDEARVDDHEDCTLLLCWPAGGAMAVNALRRYRGPCLAYVGEGRGGSTATAEFFDELERQWVEAREVAIPQWDGMQDALRIYRRRAG
jgi:hypothetical protein